MEIRVIEFGGSLYQESVDLRDKLLRKPLGLVFNRSDLALEFDSIHLGCYNDSEKLIACLILKPISQEIVKMRQVAVDETCQGKGIGTYLVHASEHIASQMGFEIICLHARSVVTPFYERLDYKCIGAEFEEVGIPHYKMQKSIVDIL